MIYKECEGCAYEGLCDYEGSCVLEPYYINKQGDKLVCPCSICLVKGVCIKSCKEIQLYYLSYRKKVKGK